MDTEKTIITVKGMSCGHCKSLVEKNLCKLPGVTNVEANLTTGETVIEGTPDMSAVKQVIEELGFSLS